MYKQKKERELHKKRPRSKKKEKEEQHQEMKKILVERSNRYLSRGEKGKKEDKKRRNVVLDRKKGARLLYTLLIYIK